MKYAVISRREAAEQRLKRFYTGRPCKYGHDAQRFVSTGGCTVCNSERAKAFSPSVQAPFTYPCHPDDRAAALAYCQGLDLARGKMPWSPTATASHPPVAEEPLASATVAAGAGIPNWSPAMLERLGVPPVPTEPYLPKP